ncbi:B-cell receptor CD22-like [Sardina pilchardus]|uniref:B-cell receptor CD22-like n=1 Tax=Sardina pilchardus TaxID=27697 RepID=UPI002E0F8753
MLEDHSLQVGLSYSLVNISSQQSGFYYCVAENEIGKHNSSSVHINVTSHTYTWYRRKNGSESSWLGQSYSITSISSEHSGLRKNRSESTRIGEGQTYNITYISTEHSGLYYCKAENRHGASDSRATYLDVHYSPRNTSASLSPSGDLHEGDSVTLTCSSDANPPVHNYTWYRKTGDGTVLQGTGRMLNLTLNLVSGVDGLYHCEARNKVGSKNSTAVVISLADPGLLRGIMFSALGVISAVTLLLVVVVCWRRQKTQSTKTSRSTHSNTQGTSDPVYDNVSTMPLASGCGQRVPADHKDDEDDVQYASVQFKPKKQQAVPSQDEDVQYASVQFNKSKPEPNVPQQPPSDMPQEETQYASLNLQGLSAATQTGDESAIYSTVNKKSKP